MVLRWKGVVHYLSPVFLKKKCLFYSKVIKHLTCQTEGDKGQIIHMGKTDREVNGLKK